MSLSDKILGVLTHKPITPIALQRDYFPEYSLNYIKQTLSKMRKNDLIEEASHCIKYTASSYTYSLGYYVIKQSI